MDALHSQGIAIPRLGLGTFRLTGDPCRQAVERALALGYRHIDTAEMYANEEEIGHAIAAARLPRADLHVTSKVWNENLATDALLRSFDASLRKLGLEYIDLYLIHWPAPGMNLPQVLSTLLRLKEQGRVRAIGVANFNIALLKQAVEDIGAPIACNQVEYHVFLSQQPLLAYQRSRGIPLVAYCPLAHGHASEHPDLRRIGEKHGVTGAQVALAWLLGQEGVAAIPKSGREANQRANLEATRVRLDAEDQRIIAALPKTRRLINPPFAPRWD